ncbi:MULTISPECIES: hypothetical protein [unclassified Mesorhizobium]|uniref:hypothetical protein n=1 Tax=unclassified Mesorhizobium TaxID=325217 RepID=UPI00333ABFFF
MYKASAFDRLSPTFFSQFSMDVLIGLTGRAAMMTFSGTVVASMGAEAGAQRGATDKIGRRLALRR